jgi:hypothetical protein
MTTSISRKLYQQFLLLYPEPFRHEFGDEMLSMFEECRATQGPWRLLGDLVVSAVKQNIYYHSAPHRNQGLRDSEIASAPKLAWILAVAICGAALIPGVLVGRKPEAPEARAVRPEVRYWFPTGTVVIKRRPDAPESWTVIRPASLSSECDIAKRRQTR